MTLPPTSRKRTPRRGKPAPHSAIPAALEPHVLLQAPAILKFSSLSNRTLHAIPYCMTHVISGDTGEGGEEG